MVFVPTEQAKIKLKEAVLKDKELAGHIEDKYRLKNRLLYLANYAQRPTRLVMWPDSCPYSFECSMQHRVDDKWEHWFTIGITYHGPHDGYGSGQGPTFSVCVERTHGWSSHT